MKILFCVGLLIGLALYKESDANNTQVVLFASFVIVGNLLGLLDEVQNNIIEKLKK